MLAALPVPPDPEGRVLHGYGNNEDAVVVRPVPPGMALVQTVDVLTPLGNNPRLFGQTAACNALSDVYAMGGEPWCAMNVAAFPSKDVPLEVLSDILRGGLEKLAEAGAVLAGGHTLDDDEIKYGLAVTGMVAPDRIVSNSGLCPGDMLVLTKPLGTGVLATAVKGGWPQAEVHEAEMYRWTTRLNANAARVLRAMDLKAATDVTGFGLGGHVLEMVRARGLCAELYMDALPFMAQVLDLASDGLVPVGSHANRDFCACRTHVDCGDDETRNLRALLTFDAQTSGGLLMAVSPARVAEACERLAALGESAWVVGRVLKERPQGLEERIGLLLS